MKNEKKKKHSIAEQCFHFNVAKTSLFLCVCLNGRYVALNFILFCSCRKYSIRLTFLKKKKILLSMPNRRDDSIYSVDSTNKKIAYIRCHIYSDREIHVITSSSSVLEFFICHIFLLQCLHNFSKQIKIIQRQLVLNSSHRQ